MGGDFALNSGATLALYFLQLLKQTDAFIVGPGCEMCCNHSLRITAVKPFYCL